MKKTAIAIIACILLVIFVYVRNPDPQSDESEISIGGISALTGVGQAIGEEERKGMQLAVDEINAQGGIKGRTVKLVSEDLSIDKIKQAGSIAQKLINIDQVVAIVGPQWDELAQPILPIIEGAKVPTIGVDNSDQVESADNYNYFFSTWYDNRVGVRELLRFAKSRSYNRVVILRPVNAGFWKFTADTFIAEAPKYDVDIVDDIDLGNPLTLDFRTTLSKIKTQKPDAIFVVTSDYNQCVLLKQSEELGLSIPSLGTESSGDGTSLKSCPDLLEHRYFSTPVKSKKQLEFEEKFTRHFGRKPLFPSAITAYEAIYIIADGLKNTNLKGGEVLRDAIAKTNKEGVVLENVVFNEKGFLNTPEDAFEMQTTRDGVFVRVAQ